LYEYSRIFLTEKHCPTTTRKGKGEGKATLRREVKVIASVAACLVGAMTSSHYVPRMTETQTERSIS